MTSGGALAPNYVGLEGFASVGVTQNTLRAFQVLHLYTDVFHGDSPATRGLSSLLLCIVCSSWTAAREGGLLSTLRSHAGGPGSLLSESQPSGCVLSWKGGLQPAMGRLPPLTPWVCLASVLSLCPARGHREARQRQKFAWCGTPSSVLSAGVQGPGTAVLPSISRSMSGFLSWYLLPL